MLPRGAERPKRDFSCFRVAQKDQMEDFRASAWRRKTKWSFFVLLRGAERPNGRFFMLPRDAERPKRGFRCYSVARKGLNKLVICCRVYSLP